MSTGEISLKWNPKNLEIKTRSVEKTLEPLVIQERLLTFFQLPALFKHIFLRGLIFYVDLGI